jgi:hypothetical protein
MKTFQSMVHVSFLVVAISLLNSRTPAQDRARLPPELNQSSSLSEVLDWLAKTSFHHARVGLKDSGSPGNPESPIPMFRDGTPAANLVFSKGFKLARLDGCHLTLRNDAVSVLHFSGKRNKNEVASLPENGKDNTPPVQAGQLFMWLERVSDTKGRGPYRHTTNSEEAKLFGTWRTTFTYRGIFARDVFSMSINDPEKGGMREVMTAETLTFTFDDRETSERFNAAFRQAIKLCKGR